MAPLPRFDNLPLERQKSILGAAAEEIAAHGLEEASINRILDGAGIGKSSFYYYFANKDDLYAAVIEQVLEELLAAMQPASVPACADDYWEMWRAMYVAFLERQIEDPTLANLSWSSIQSRAAGAAHPSLAALVERLERWLQAHLELGQRLGAVREDVPFDLLLQATFGMLEGGDRWVAGAWDKMDVDYVPAAATLIVQLLKGLISAPSEASEDSK